MFEALSGECGKGRGVGKSVSLMSKVGKSEGMSIAVSAVGTRAPAVYLALSPPLTAPAVLSKLESKSKSKARASA